jgi:hypothetical protein
MYLKNEVCVLNVMYELSDDDFLRIETYNNVDAIY